MIATAFRRHMTTNATVKQVAQKAKESFMEKHPIASIGIGVGFVAASVAVIKPEPKPPMEQGIF
jgi:ElaB/YqjD/DUF883 family membrane-anchored ribosome-binding protein